jgi:D-alanyl-D-alanine carboxypeptidase
VVALLAAGADVTTDELARAAGGDGRSRIVETGEGESSQPLQGPARQAELKARFGEPAVGLPYGDDWVRLDPAFLRRWIVSRQVPVLGSVTCHRKMLPALRAALRELDRLGLARLVDPGDYAGCYAPRRIRPGGSLSLHAWGLAVDLNASANPFGGRSRQDRRLVRIMERHGFTWGGDFPTTPDPMHFEFRGRLNG